jgi:hypothetical protein
MQPMVAQAQKEKRAKRVVMVPRAAMDAEMLGLRFLRAWIWAAQAAVDGVTPPVPKPHRVVVQVVVVAHVALVTLRLDLSSADPMLATVKAVQHGVFQA